MQQVPSSPSSVVLVGEFELLSPDRMFEYLTRPELLSLWWPPHATADPRLGGKFHYSWPEQNWNLRGEFTAFKPGTHLGFTWCWDHEPVEHGLQQVEIFLESIHDGGTLVGLFHDKFEATEDDQAARQGVAEGWIHFLMRLGGLTAGAVE